MTDEKNKQHIGYKPNLQYTDEYYSEIETNNNYTSNSNNNDNNGKDDTVDNLINSMNGLQNMINGLPNELSDILDEIYDPVMDFIYDELKDKTLENVPEEIEEIWDTDYHPPIIDDVTSGWTGPTSSDENDNDNKNEKPPVIKIWDDTDFFPVKKKHHTEEEITEKEYIKNLVDLFTDFNDKLSTVLTNFWTNFFISANKKTPHEIKILLNNILLNSSDVKQDAQHLLDFAVTNNIIKSMKLDYYNLTFNLEETIKRLQQLKAMQQLRLKYSKIKEVEGSTKTNQMNNNILIASKMIYSNKYDKAYENLYRYLNSSTVILNDALQSWIQEIKSKQILIERKGIL